MDLKTEKEILKKELDQIEDVRLLDAIRKIMEYGRSTAVRNYGPMTEDEYFNRITESRKAIGEGKLITQEEAIEYFRRKNG